MKFVFIFVVLVCANLHFCQAGNTSGNQKVCASPCAPININVHGNHGIKDTSKPSAHIEAVNKNAITYQKNTVIKDWSAGAPHSHLAGGMTYSDGKLTVPICGRYYIYIQLFYYSWGRVVIRVNNNSITMIQPMDHGKGTGTGLYAGGVFNLKAGDNITLVVTHTMAIFMWSEHSSFGAFLV